MITSRFDPRIPFYLLILLSVSFVLSIFAMQLFGGILIILWLFESNSEKKRAIDKFIIAATVYGISRLLAIIFSEYPDDSIPALYKEALFFLSFFSLGFYFKTFDDKKIKFLVYSFIAGAAINSIIGLVRFNAGIVERAESFSSGYTVFSGYLAAALGIATAAFKFNETEKKYSWLIIISAAIIFAGIITSLGRVNIAVAVLILIFSIIFKMISFKKLIFILLISGAISFISFYNNRAEVTQRIESPAQLSDRDILYKGAGEILWEHPFLGYGPRTFKEIFPFKEKFSDKGISGWHNHILQVYFESGLMGLAVYICFFTIIFYSGYRFIMRTSGTKKIISQGVMLACTALFLAAFFSSVIDTPVLSIVFVFLVSIMTSELYKESFTHKT